MPTKSSGKGIPRIPGWIRSHSRSRSATSTSDASSYCSIGSSAGGKLVTWAWMWYERSPKVTSSSFGPPAASSSDFLLQPSYLARTSLPLEHSTNSSGSTVDSSVHSSALQTLGAQTLFATPVDRKVPRVRIRTRQASELIGQKILVAIDDWRPTSRYPDGHFVRALGATESQEAEE